MIRVALTMATALLMLLMILAETNTANAAEIKVLSGNGGRAAVSELASRFERTSGHTVMQSGSK